MKSGGLIKAKLVSDEMLILVPCFERCDKALVLKLPLTAASLEAALAAKGWIFSVLDEHINNKPIVANIVCDECAKKVHPPEVLAEMARRRANRPS